MSALLRVEDLSVSYAVRGARGMRRLTALRALSFELARGQTLGVVGESGSGKSTLARALLRLIRADAGTVRFGEEDWLALSPEALQRQRRHMQLVFQDPLAALDPRQRVGEAIGEPLRFLLPELPAVTRAPAVAQMLQQVGLSSQYAERYPHELSGGQAQRVGIARALIVQPQLLVCDEPLSALDVSIKAQILNLLKTLQQQSQLALLFIAHDLPAVRVACDHVLVLYLGRVMEIGSRDAVFTAARHPYTRTLLSSVAPPDPRLARRRRATVVASEPPSALAAPSGCVFRTRCAWAIERCAREVPALRELGESRVACHRAEELPSLRSET